jgi:hypothetical protein
VLKYGCMVRKSDIIKLLGIVTLGKYEKDGLESGI